MTKEPQHHPYPLFQRIALKRQAVLPGDRLRDDSGVLIAATPDAEFDALMQRHCLAEAQSYYRVPRVDILVVLREQDLSLRADVH